MFQWQAFPDSLRSLPIEESSVVTWNQMTPQKEGVLCIWSQAELRIMIYNFIGKHKGQEGIYKTTTLQGVLSQFRTLFFSCKLHTAVYIAVLIHNSSVLEHFS